MSWKKIRSGCAKGWRGGAVAIWPCDAVYKNTRTGEVRTLYTDERYIDKMPARVKRMDELAARWYVATRKHLLVQEMRGADSGSPRGKLGPRILGWSLGALALATAGGVLWWKWSQIGHSGVPLNFALRRTFSRNFLEGSRGLVAAWEAQRQPVPAGAPMPAA